MATAEERGAFDAGGIDATRQRALRSLRVPATLQVIVSGGGLLLLVGAFVLMMFVSAGDPHPNAPRMRATFGVMMLGFVAVSALALAGGIASLRGRNYALAVAGAIAAIASFHTTILGIAVGIWHLVTLRGAGVQEAFAGSSASGVPPATMPPPPPMPMPCAPPRPVAAAAPRAAPPLSDSAADPLRGVRLPGAFTIAAGALGVLLWTIGLLMPADPTRPGDESMMRILAAGELLVALTVLAAGIAMVQGRRYALAMTGAVLLCATCVCALPGIPLGIWSLVQLNRPGVIEAFRQQRT